MTGTNAGAYHVCVSCILTHFHARVHTPGIGGGAYRRICSFARHRLGAHAVIHNLVRACNGFADSNSSSRRLQE